MTYDFKDQDPGETGEWIEALEGVLEAEGAEKAKYLIRRLSEYAARKGISLPFEFNTPYVNTIPPEESDKMPGNTEVARNVAAYVRWNAMAMVDRANRDYPGIGGHIATYASAAVLYEVGYDYFFRGPQSQNGGDLVYFQGHSSPGMYARAFVEGRLEAEDLLNFRRETDGKGLSSYPHPWLMPDFWQFPTVSMGLGPAMAVYQARFMKYMAARGLAPMEGRRVWAFLGDGETDEPESRGVLSIAARENLDNLIFVINCNLQRLDGPVRGNGKIVQELESAFRGAGWNVIKVIWGTEWDKILARDTKGILREKLENMVDGDFQNLGSKGGDYIREKIFNTDPFLKELVKDFSDRDIRQLSRGGHDPRKVYAAFAAACRHTGSPTVIIAKTTKGFGMGESGESANIAHNQKKMDAAALKEFRDRFHVPLKDDQLEELPFIRPPEGSEEYRFIHEQRKKLGGYLPGRRKKAAPLDIPPLDTFTSLLGGSDDRTVSTTMGFVRLLSALCRDEKIGKHIVPIVPDEARTFGMEGLFRQLGIYSPVGQLYEPEDRESIMWYREDAKGQILEEGITETGALASWIAAGTAYSNYNINMVPFYTFYSMFGFQRTGDLAWAAGDVRARGFLLGATSGRTTLNGEGLQHQDGHSHLLAAVIPNCRTYDPTFTYEMVVIIQDGLRRMFHDQEDIFYYLTLMNEKYPQPALPEGVTEGILKGMYLLREGMAEGHKVQLMGSGAILNEVIAAAELLANDFGVSADIWSVPGINQLNRDGIECERFNRLHPGEKQKTPYLTSLLQERKGPAVIATDYLRAYPELIRRLVPMPYTILGTDGFGRSDTREKLRGFFEIDRYHVVVAALSSLRDQGIIDAARVSEAIKKYNIDADKSDPLTH